MLPARHTPCNKALCTHVSEWISLVAPKITGGFNLCFNLIAASSLPGLEDGSIRLHVAVCSNVRDPYPGVDDQQSTEGPDKLHGHGFTCVHLLAVVCPPNEREKKQSGQESEVIE